MLTEAKRDCEICNCDYCPYEYVACVEDLRTIAVSSVKKRICSMLEEFVHNDNSRLARQFVHAKQCQDFTLPWKDPRDLSIRHKEEDVAENGIKGAIKYLIKDGLVTCVLDAVLLDSRLNRLCEELDALGIEQNLIKNLISIFVGGKNYWINGCVSSYSKESVESATETYSSDLEVEIGSNTSEYLPASCTKPLKRRTGHDTPCNDHIGYAESTVSRGKGRLTFKDTFEVKKDPPCGPRFNNQNQVESLGQKNIDCRTRNTINSKAAEKHNETDKRRTQDSVETTMRICSRCRDRKHCEGSMPVSTEKDCQTVEKKNCEKSINTDRSINVHKSVQIFWTCSCLKLIIRKTRPTDCGSMQLASRPARIACLTLPCVSSKLAKQIFMTDSSLSEPCRLVIKRKFKAGLGSVCSCLNDVLARLNANLIGELSLNCDIRPGYISFRLTSRDTKKVYFANRVPICRHVRKRSVNVSGNVTKNITSNVTDPAMSALREQIACKCKMRNLNGNLNMEMKSSETKETLADQYRNNNCSRFDGGSKVTPDEKSIPCQVSRKNSSTLCECSEKQSKSDDNYFDDRIHEKVAGIRYVNKRHVNLYLPCSNNDMLPKEIVASKNMKMSVERSTQYEKEVEFIFSRDFNKDFEEKEFVLSSVNTSRNGIVGSDGTNYTGNKTKEFCESVERMESQEEQLSTVNEGSCDIETQELPDNSPLIARQDDSLEVNRSLSLENCAPSTVPTIDDDSTFECSCCDNNRSKSTPLQEIIEKLQVSPFRGLETLVVDRTDVVPKNVLSTSAQTPKIEKVSTGINANTTDEQSNMIPNEIRSTHPLKETVDQCTETGQEEMKENVRNQSQSTESFNRIRIENVHEAVSGDERGSFDKSKEVKKKTDAEQIVPRLNSSSGSEKSPTITPTNRCGSVRSERVKVTLPTSHLHVPLRCSSRENLHMRNAGIELRARVSLNESRKRRRIASVTKISYKAHTAENARLSSKDRTKNSVVPGNLYGFLPNKSVDRLKQLICTKLLRMLADKTSDKATNTSKTFLRNEKYVVSVLKGKLRRVGRTVDKVVKIYSPGNSSICTSCISQNSISSEVCTAGITNSCGDSDYSKRCRCGTDISMKNCSPRLSGGAYKFFTNAHCILRIPDKRACDRRNISNSGRTDTGNMSRGRRNMSMNYCSSEYLKERKRIAKIPSNSWHEEYRSREVLEEERNSIGIPVQDFCDWDDVSKRRYPNEQRANKSLRERRYVDKVANKRFDDGPRILKRHPFRGRQSNELLEQNDSTTQGTTRTWHRKEISKTCFVSHGLNEGDGTSRNYRSNIEDSIICYCEQCVGGRQLDLSYTQSTDAIFSDAANCSAYSGRIKDRVRRKSGWIRMRREERGTSHEHFRDNEGRHRSSGKVERACFERNYRDNKTLKSPVLVVRRGWNKNFEKSLESGAIHVSRVSSRSRNINPEIHHFCRCGRCKELSHVLKEDPSNTFIEQSFRTREERNRDHPEERVTDLRADFKWKLSQYVALCKSVKRTLIKRLRPADIYEVNSVSTTRNDGHERQIFAK